MKRRGKRKGERWKRERGRDITGRREKEMANSVLMLLLVSNFKIPLKSF